MCKFDVVLSIHLYSLCVKSGLCIHTSKRFHHTCRFTYSFRQNWHLWESLSNNSNSRKHWPWHYFTGHAGHIKDQNQVHIVLFVCCPPRVFSFLVRSPGRAQACCIAGRNLWATTSQLQGESSRCPLEVVSQWMGFSCVTIWYQCKRCFSHILQTRQLSENIWSTWTQVRRAQPSRVGLETAVCFDIQWVYWVFTELHADAVLEWTGTKTAISWQRSQLNPAPFISGTPALTKAPR